MEPLTRRQRKVLNFILDCLKINGYAPSIREIAEQFDIASPTGVVHHLEALEKKGYLRRAHGARAIQIVRPSEEKNKPDAGVVYLPVIGRIAAGTPILAEENIEGYEAVSKSLVRHPHAFLLRVHGDSMTGDHILNGDLVIVQPQATAENGEIVAALVDEEATVKRFYRMKNFIELRPSNPKHKPFRFTEGVQIQGKVVGVQRKL
jgi:repressor LexA